LGFSPATLSLPALAVSGFLVSLGTVAIPGPITLVASRLVIARRLRHAIWFLCGVTTLDIALFVALATGAAPALAHIGAMPIVELAGGLALLVAGGLTLRRHLPASATPPPSPIEVETAGGSFALGLVVAGGNPQYWVWWVTAGLAFVEAARSHGPLGLTVMLAALVGGVVSWYVPLLWALRRGRQLLSPRGAQRIERLLGVLLALLGLGLAALGTWRLSRR
jgi:threonine/homoserine/homoserine lactone efflux protein